MPQRRNFDEVMIVNPYDPGSQEGATTMNFFRPRGYPRAPGYPPPPHAYPPPGAPYPGPPMMAPSMYPPQGFAPPPPEEFGYYGEPAGYYAEAPEYGYYGEPIAYYAEAPEYGYYGEPADYAVAEAPEYGYYGEMEPVGYYAESPELVGWGVGEDPTGMGCTCNTGGRMQGYADYSGYGRYVPDEPPRSIPNVVAATNLNGYMGESPEYSGAGYGETEYGEPEYGEPEYGEPEYGEADYGETAYDGYVAPADISPTCTSFTSPATKEFVPEHFRPHF
ncbi:MAG: hypothetical protein ACKV22_40085 [Bryobacteraceae bacterium]